MTTRTAARAGTVSAGMLALVLGASGVAFADLSPISTVTTVTTTTTSTVTGLLPSPSPSSSLLDPVTSLLPSPSSTSSTLPLPLPTVSSLPLPLPTSSPTPTSPAPVPSTSTLPGTTLPGGTLPGGTSGSAPQAAAPAAMPGLVQGAPATAPRQPANPQSANMSAPSYDTPHGAMLGELRDSALPALPDLPATDGPIRLSAGSAPALAPVPNLPSPSDIARGTHEERTILGGIAIIVAMVAVGSLGAGHASVWFEARRRRLRYA